MLNRIREGNPKGMELVPFNVEHHLENGIDCKTDAGLDFISAVNLRKRNNMENKRKSSRYFSTFQSIYFVQIDHICIHNSLYIF
jgi:hypothetical protein